MLSAAATSVSVLQLVPVHAAVRASALIRSEQARSRPVRAMILGNLAVLHQRAGAETALEEPGALRRIEITSGWLQEGQVSRTAGSPRS